MTPCSSLSYNRRFGGTYRLNLQGRRNRFGKRASKQVASKLARWFAEPNFSTLKMEAISSSETSVVTQRTTRRHIHRCENLKFYTSVFVVFGVITATNKQRGACFLLGLFLILKKEAVRSLEILMNSYRTWFRLIEENIAVCLQPECFPIIQLTKFQTHKKTGNVTLYITHSGYA
jgi:hypothetical protein